MPHKPQEIQQALSHVRERMEKAGMAPRPGAGPLLIAVSKAQSLGALEAAIAAGQTHFGENRVQEAQGKWPQLKARHPQVRLHLIGPLQTNKVKDALALFDTIETLDRLKLADALAGEIEKTGRRPECFIQVNTGEEPQKAGVSPQGADSFIAYCAGLGLPVVGLMCVPPEADHPAPHFALLRGIAQRHGLQRLSMGMTNDFEIAIRMGATQVRVGRAIFGERN